MFKLLHTFFLLPCLSACVPYGWQGARQELPAAGWRHTARQAAHFDFNWRLSGDRHVAPMQVFDDGHRTWLQFAPGQSIPAIFVQDGAAMRPAVYTRQEPYVIVEGAWRALIMRGGALQARADHIDEAPSPSAAHQGSTRSRSMPVHAPSPHAGPVENRMAVAAPALAMPSTAASPERRVPHVRRVSAVSGAPTLFRASPDDLNMRRALVRWAAQAGWTFRSEHWAVDIDIPLAGSADFSTDFKQSVRGLLAATELAERPLQPCFYANRVLRVVPLPQACDRTVSPAGAQS